MLMQIENIPPTNITNPESVADICRTILALEAPHDQDKEHLWVLGLNTSSQVKYIDLVTLGILDNSLAHPREIFRLAVMQGVASIVLAHNHPGGSINPSREDLALTKTVKEAGKILGIPLMDHVIITWKGFWSAMTAGVL